MVGDEPVSPTLANDRSARLLRTRSPLHPARYEVPGFYPREAPATVAEDGACSIVIPTHDRPDKVSCLLQSIRAHATRAVDRVIVVDDSPHPRDLPREFPDLPLDHVVLSTRVFISRAKNIGWRRVRSPFVFFIDDDNVVTRDTLERPLDFMTSSPRIGAVVPAVLYKERPELVWVYATPLSSRRWGHVLLGRNLPRDPGLENRILDTDALPNAALVRREALIDIGGFNEGMAVNSSADAALRLKQSGWRVCAHTGAFILHDVEPPGRVGYWAQHGLADPARVYHEVCDWFLLMRSLHRNEGLFAIRATLHASGFMLPNGLSYLLQGGSKGRESTKQLIRGYLDSVKTSRDEFPREDGPCREDPLSRG